MKHFISVFVALLLSLSLLAGNSAEEKAIRMTIQQFKDSGDMQNVDHLLTAAHPEFAIFYMGQEGLVKMARADFKELLSAKKIGGSPRKLSIHSIKINESIASAEADFENASASFGHYFNLMKIDGKWQLMNAVVRFVPKG